jgi:hypothetical protein
MMGGTVTAFTALHIILQYLVVKTYTLEGGIPNAGESKLLV